MLKFFFWSQVFDLEVLQNVEVPELGVEVPAMWFRLVNQRRKGRKAPAAVQLTLVV
jgi:hypothetical protein